MDTSVLVASPIKAMPEGWQDEKRSNSLFAPFRKKELNPVDWESKMKFWQTAIEKWCMERNVATVSIKLLRKEFKRKDKSPSCLAVVIEELLRNGEIRRKSDFLSAVPYQSWSSWAVNSFIKAPVSWSFSKVIGPSSTVENEEEEYVHMAFLKERGLELLNATEDKEEDIITCQEAREILSNESCPLSIESLDMILHWLQLEQKARVEEVNGRRLIKLVHHNKRNRQPSNISQADLAIFKVQHDISTLSQTVEHLETEKEKCVEEAKGYLQKGLRQSAKNCLRKKKELERCIEKRGTTLDNLEILLSRLRSTESDAKVLEAYKVGLAALKSTFKNSDISEDSVFNTISELQEMNDLKDEIETALSQPVISSVTATDDLEKELDDILSESELAATFGLPDVPTTDISSIKVASSNKDSLLSPPQS